MCIFSRPGWNPWNWILKVLKRKIEIIPANRAQRLDKKWSHLRLKSLKCQKWLFFCIFYWWQLIHSFGKLFKSIWKILISSSRKCYELLDSELPLSTCCPLKIQGFGFFFSLTQEFSLYFYSRYFTNSNSKAYWPYQLLKEFKKIFQVDLYKWFTQTD